MQPIQSMLQSIENISKKSLESTASFLDNNPAVYKIVILACHFFRAAGMYGFMLASPLSLPATCALGLGASFLYRASIERYCYYRFALPSCFGAGAFSVSKAAVIKLFSKKAYKTLSEMVLNLAGASPLIGYAGYVVYVSHKEFEQKKRGCGSDCH